MVYHYVDTENGEELDPSANTYSVMELAREHQKRYVFKSSEGMTVILRHLPLRMKRIIDSMTAMIFPSANALREKVMELGNGIRDIPIENIPEDVKTEFLKASAEYRTIAQYYALGVIEEPRCCTMEDVDEIYSRITESERDSLDMLIQELVRTKTPEEVDATGLTLADRFHVQLVDREMLEEMTVTQADYFLRVIERENADIQRLMRERK